MTTGEITGLLPLWSGRIDRSTVEYATGERHQALRVRATADPRT